MNPDMFLTDIFLALVVTIVTTCTGGGFVFFLTKGRNIVARIALSFATGFVIISLSGILASFFSLSPPLFQIPLIILGIILFIIFCKNHQLTLPNRQDSTVLILAGVYVLILISFFTAIVIWRAGDVTVHASIVRMIMDGISVPVSIYPVGSSWDYYPKGFHYYTSFWTLFFPLINTITIIPILITAATSVLLYAVIREYYPGWCACTAFILACFCFPQHFDNLIWGGYPSATAQMLFVAIILAIIIEKRILLLLLLGLLLTHTRFIIYLVPVLAFWIGGEWMIQSGLIKKERIYILTGICILILFLLCIPLMLSSTSYIFWILSEKTLTTEFITRWVFALLSVFGILIAYYRFHAMERLALAWVAGLSVIVLLVDSEILVITTATRVISQLYLPFAFFAAIALAYMTWQLKDTRLRTIVSVFLILGGIGIMGAVFYSYAGSFALPEDDYQAMQWLRDQNFTHPICINIDPTGMLVYPLTGIPVTEPTLIPKPEINGSFSFSELSSKIVADPTDPTIPDLIRSLPYHPVLLYISSISRTNPDYNPPFFNFYDGIYRTVNVNEMSDYYTILYDSGATIVAIS